MMLANTIIDADEKVLSVLAIELLNDFLLKAGQAVQGSGFIDSSVLASVSHLKQYLPQKALLYSQGVNTYLAIIIGVNYEDNLSELKKIIDDIKAPVNVEGIEYLPSPKIGFLGRVLQGNESSQDLIRHATSALMQIRNTRQTYMAYAEKEDENLSQKFRILSTLPQALLSQDQISLAFQPIVELRTKKCVELECLLRWNHPEMGPISPFSILNWVEETPLMQDLSLRIIDLAVEAAKQLASHSLFPKIGINLSSCDLYFERIYQKIAVAAELLQPGQLVIEITETAMVEDLDTISKQLERFRSMDIRVHVDDFGVGQSSLSYLTKLPAQVIKLDQSFLRQVDDDPANLKVASGITTIAKELGFEVIMEGVEFDQDVMLSQFIQPTYIQGYHIARPMPLADAIRWLKQQS